MKITMKNLLRESRLLLLAAVCAALAPRPLFSAGTDGPAGLGGGSVTIKNPLRESIDTLPELVSVIVGAVVQVGVPVVALGIIYSGFLFVKAQGKPEEIKTAKSAFTWTIVGAAIVLGAFVVLEIVQGTIGQLQE